MRLPGLQRVQTPTESDVAQGVDQAVQPRDGRAPSHELLKVRPFGPTCLFGPRFPGRPSHHSYYWWSHRWLTTDEAYEVQFQPHYEPWVMCDRMAVPWYDPRFRGYGKNKISHLEQMNRTGFRCGSGRGMVSWVSV